MEHHDISDLQVLVEALPFGKAVENLNVFLTQSRPELRAQSAAEIPTT